MRIRSKRIRQHNKWTSIINESKDEYASSIIKIANSLVRQGKNLKTSKELEELFLQSKEQVLDLTFESLEQTYSYSCSMVKEMYNITSKPIDLKDLTYNDDGKTLDERLLEYFQELNEYVLDYIKNNEPIVWDTIKRSLHQRLLLVLDTETQTVKNKVIRLKVEGHCEFGEILSGECDSCPGSGGIYPIDELDIPPFHPECMCEVIYYEELTDVPEEIEDLELEIEDISLDI